MTEDNADRQHAAGWPGQPFPGPPPSPYPSGPPARPSSASAPPGPPEARQPGSSSPSQRGPFTYSPPTADQISHDPRSFAAGPQAPAAPSRSASLPPTAPLPDGLPPAPAPARPPSFGGPAPSPAGPPRPSESPFSAPPRQSTMPGQAAASEVHQTVRIPPAERPTPETPAPWTARPADPFSQPGSPDSAFDVDPYASELPSTKSGPGALARVLGVVVGLLLGLLGLVGVLVGNFSPEGNQTKGLWFGVGLALLVAAVLLGLWTAATPVTAGIVGAAPGLFGVIAPATWAELVGKLPEIDLGFDLAGLSANDAIRGLGTHPAAAVGVLLVVAGVTTVLGRRKGAAQQV